MLYIPNKAKNTFFIQKINNNVKMSPELKNTLLDSLKTQNFLSIITPKKKFRIIIDTQDSKKLIEEESLKPLTQIEEINMIADEYTINEIIMLSNNNNVINLNLDNKVKTYIGNSVDYIRAEPYLDYTQNTFGKGVKVCVLDTGIDDTHPYIGNILPDHKKSFVEGLSYLDVVGHGTHVAGIIMASAKRTKQVRIKDHVRIEDGVAPDVDLYIGKVMDDNGEGYDSDILKGLFWCVNEVHADIVSLSLGGGQYKGTCDSEYSCKFFNLFSNKTIIVVASGNEGQDGGGEPGCCSGVISVANFKRDYSVDYSSSRNLNVKIGAIGTDVTSTIPGNKFATWSGTSMATPHVSGVFALLKSLKPTTTNEELKNIVLSTASDKGYKEYEQGYGLINAYEACKKLIGNCDNIFNQKYRSQICGNGIKEGNEECDTNDIQKSCSDLGLLKGILSCNQCKFVTSLCGKSECGENSDCPPEISKRCFIEEKKTGVIEGLITTEQQSYCDKNSQCVPFGDSKEYILPKDSCEGGKVCSNNQCVNIPNHCGNNVREGLEQCDGNNIEDSCESLGLGMGELKCNQICNYNTSGCSNPKKVGYIFYYDEASTIFETEPCDNYNDPGCEEGDYIYFAKNCGEKLNQYYYSVGNYYFGSCYDLVKSEKSIQVRDTFCINPQLIFDNAPTHFYEPIKVSRYVYECSDGNILSCQYSWDSTLIKIYTKKSKTIPPTKSIYPPMESRCGKNIIPNSEPDCVDYEMDIISMQPTALYSSYINYNGKIYNDSCVGNDYVQEYWCENNNKKTKKYKCSDFSWGDTKYACYNGACVDEKVIPISLSLCQDFDNGLNILEASYVSYKNKNYQDICKKSSKRTFTKKGDRVKEYYCDGDKKKYKYVYCGAGISCINGACTA